MESKADKLKRATSGLVVIMVGVLLALGAEASWSQRGERIREQELLTDLLEEFGDNEARLLADIRENELAQAAAAAWLEIMLGNASATRDSIAALYVASTEDARFDPVTGALRSLVDGGELHLIQNGELRRALAGWPDLAAEARLTATSWDNQRQSLNTVVLGMEPGGPWTVGQETAARLAVAAVGKVNFQLEDLVERVRAIIALIETEMTEGGRE